MDDSLDYAERGVIGATLRDPKCFDEAALKYCQFFNPKHQVIWQAITDLRVHGKQIDELTVSSKTKGTVTPIDLTSYSNLIGVSPDIVAWSSVIRDQYVQRNIQTIASDYARWQSLGMTGPEMLTKVRERVEELEGINDRQLPTLAEVARHECARIASAPLEDLQGLPTGLGIERVVPGGIPRGKVTTLFGESGNYKTTVKNNIVLGIASAGHTVLDVSLEDADELTAHRFIAQCTGLNYGKIAAYDLDATERNQLEAIPDDALSAAENVILAGEIPPNIDEIIRTARYYKYKRNLAAVVIDYVQLLESRNPRLTERDVLNEIMRKCQLAAKRDNIAYVIVSQVKQDVDQRANHEPRITDMLGSSAMRTASKLSIGVYRPALYHERPVNAAYERLVANHRHGEQLYRNMIELHFLKNVLGEPQTVVHCTVSPGTGTLKSFDMRPYL